MKCLAYYYAGWHAALYRDGQNEWNTLRNNRPRFTGHTILLPKEYYDDTRPETIWEQVQLASKYWIQGFVVCYYFDGKDEVFSEGLEKGLIPALVDSEQFCFSLLVSARLPRKYFPLENGKDDSTERKKRQVLYNQEMFASLLRNILRKYATNTAYYFIEGRPVIFLFQYYDFFPIWEHDETILATKKSIAREFGYENLYIVGTTDYTNKAPIKSWVDFYTSYNSLPNYTSGKPIQDYSECVLEEEKQWEKFGTIFQKRYVPSISVGFDSSSRGQLGYPMPRNLSGGRHYPWYPIVTAFNISMFIIQARAAYQRGSENNAPFLTVCAWNEWTEGCILLPDTCSWEEKLAALQEAFSPTMHRQIDEHDCIIMNPSQLLWTYSRYLFVFAHPDDEMYVCVLMSELCKQGKQVQVLYITSGDYSGPEYAWERKREVLASMWYIWVSPEYVHFLGVSERTLMDQATEARNAMLAYVQEMQPDCIVGHDFEGGHNAHDLSSFLSGVVARERGIPFFAFPAYHGWPESRRYNTFINGRVADYELVFTEVQKELQAKVISAHRTQEKFVHTLITSRDAHLFGSREVLRKIPDTTDYTIAPDHPVGYEYPGSKLRFKDFASMIRGLVLWR